MIQRGVARLLRASGLAVLPEFTLATGRRADLIGGQQQSRQSLRRGRRWLSDGAGAAAGDGRAPAQRDRGRGGEHGQPVDHR